MNSNFGFIPLRKEEAPGIKSLNTSNFNLLKILSVANRKVGYRCWRFLDFTALTTFYLIFFFCNYILCRTLVFIEMQIISSNGVLCLLKISDVLRKQYEE